MSGQVDRRRPTGWFRRFLRVGVVLGVLGIAMPIVMGDPRFIISGVVSLVTCLALLYPDRMPSELITRAEGFDRYLWARPGLLAIVLLAAILIPALFLIVRAVTNHPR